MSLILVHRVISRQRSILVAFGAKADIEPCVDTDGKDLEPF